MKKLLVMLMLMSLGVLAQDLFMGDYMGTAKAENGNETPMCAQVWATGKGGYQAVFRETLYQVPASKVALKLDGRLEGDKVVFPQGAVIANGTFKGAAGALGVVDMKSFQFTSPTLGLKAPANAMVLVGPGMRLSQWRNATKAAGIVNFNNVLGKVPNSIAYMQNVVVSAREQTGFIRSGSDDGIIIILNGNVVYEKNVPRSLSTDEDKVPVKLNAGENKLLVKVTQGGGDWAAHLRICGADDKALPGVSYKIHPQGTPMNANGAVLAWQVAGPYVKAGVNGFNLARESFAPEAGNAEWKLVEMKNDGGERWNVLDDGTLEWKRGGGSIVSVPEYGSCTMHVEFKTSYMPEARGQGRCNSGVYTQGRYELQILDSYALEGRDNECGGIYQQSRPKVNMCLPPETWQTYDIDFTAAAFDAEGKKTADAKIKIFHNGVLIQDIPNLHVTPGGLGGVDVAKGPLMLQDHGNLLWFRNVWFVEK